MNGYNCSCVAGYTGKNCSIGKPILFKIVTKALHRRVYYSQRTNSLQKIEVNVRYIIVFSSAYKHSTEN